MPRNRKYFQNNSVLFITTRTETGLPFPPSYHLNFLLWGILAKAQNLYDVKVCHFVFMSNHLHMILVVNNPEDVSSFVGHIKSESAHAVNRILGRRQRTIWCDGYDSPSLLTSSDVIKYIEYIYMNPSNANLENSIAKYPGLSSWKMFVTGEMNKMCKRIFRGSITKLLPSISINQQKKIVQQFEEIEGEQCLFNLEPNAWMDCFPGLKGCDSLSINAKLIEDITDQEIKLEKIRKKKKKSVIGETALRKQSMLKEHTPEKYERKSICLCFDQGLRKAFVSHFRRLDYQAKTTFRLWEKGDTSTRMPPGVFAPRMPTVVSELYH